MKLQRLAHWICIFLLLFAQQQALAHAPSHRPAPQSAKQLDTDPASLNSDACDLDRVWAQVLGAAGITACCLSVPQLTGASSIPHFRSRLARDLPAHRSRGPPVLS